MASNATFSTSDAQALSDIGFDFVMKTARIAFEGVCYGIYLILMYFVILIFSQNGWQSKRSVFLVIVIIVMFAGCSTFYAMDIADLVIRFKVILMSDLDRPVAEKLDEANVKTQALMWTGEMLFIFMLTLGDSVVLWRTWSLYQDQVKFMVIPSFTWLGSVIAAFYELGCDVHTHWAVNDPTPSAASEGAESCARADTSSYSLSFGTNFICTGLIVYKAWQHRQFMSQFLGRSRKKTQAERVLTLFVESGAVYLVLYTLQAIPIYGGTTHNSYIPWLVVNAIIQQGMGMYPTAIVVLVQMQKSLWAENGSQRGPARTQSRMEFAPGRSRHQTTTTTTTNTSLGMQVTGISLGSMGASQTTAAGSSTVEEVKIHSLLDKEETAMCPEKVV